MDFSERFAALEPTVLVPDERAEFERAVARCTERELRFATEVARGSRLADALLAAGYQYNGSTIRRTQEGARIRARPHVSAVERSLRRLAAERAVVDGAAVRRELALIAFSSITDYVFNAERRVEVAQHASPEVIRAVARVNRQSSEMVSTNGTKVVRQRARLLLWNKVAALRILAEDLGLIGPRPL